jgi:hypothetical protein
MSQFFISKIKIRRGTNSQRILTRLDQGELSYTIDTNRLYVGNGITLGGVSVTNKINTSVSIVNNLSSVYAEIGDIVPINNVWYQLTATPHTNIANWGRLATKISNELEYDASSTLNVKLSGLSASKINPNTVTDGLVIRDNRLRVNYDTNFFRLSSNVFTLSGNSITEREIKSTSFGNGISGGNNIPIRVIANPSQFFYVNRVLNISSDALTKIYLPQATTNDLTLLNGGVYGNPKIGDLASVDGVFYQLSANPSTNLENWKPIIDRNSVEKSIFSTLTGLNTAGLATGLGSLFSGTPAHTITGAIPGLTVTRLSAVALNTDLNDGSTVTVMLTSAGFLTFEGDTYSRNNQLVGRFAIPIFAY